MRQKEGRDLRKGSEAEKAEGSAGSRDGWLQWARGGVVGRSDKLGTAGKPEERKRTSRLFSHQHFFRAEKYQAERTGWLALRGR